MMACCLGMALALAAADDWPQFRGPTGQGIVISGTLPLTWSETENIAWRTALPGNGWSSPVLRDGRIWVTAATEEGRSLRVVCLAVATGELLFDREALRATAPPPVNPKNTHASPTPVVLGDRVLAHFGTSGTAAVEARTGAVLWTNQTLPLEHKEGPGSSLMTVDDKVIFNGDGMDVQFVVALDSKTGKIVWKTTRSKDFGTKNPDFRKAYSTPLLITVGNQRQLISAGAERVYSYDPASGKELWFCDYQGFSTVPRPVYGHGMLFVCSGYTAPQLLAIRTDGTGDVTTTHVAWKETKQISANPSPLLVGDELYLVSDQGVVTCFAAKTGAVLWKERLGGNFSASPLAAGGRLYFFDEQGTTTVLRAGPKFQRLASNKLAGRIMASPGAAAGALFVRTDKFLYRIQQQ